eukprot:c24721_g1_i3 orf=105-686(+)
MAVLINPPANLAIAAPAQALAWPWRHIPQQPRNSTVTPHKKLEFAKLLSSGCSLEERPDSGLSKARVWLPLPPSIQRPRTAYNAASLAYLGDCVYEDALIKQLLKDNFLSEDERNIVKWGRNIQSGQKRATRRAGAAVYCGASSLETLIGHLYLTNVNRLEEVMSKLGFCSWSNVNHSVLGVEPLSDRSSQSS